MYGFIFTSNIQLQIDILDLNSFSLDIFFFYVVVAVACTQHSTCEAVNRI